MRAEIIALERTQMLTCGRRARGPLNRVKIQLAAAEYHTHNYIPPSSRSRTFGHCGGDEWRRRQREKAEILRQIAAVESSRSTGLNYKLASPNPASAEQGCKSCLL